MFHMIHEIMAMLVIKVLCQFIYDNRLKQIKFCLNKFCSTKYVLSCEMIVE
jgi:hypothetical protein